MKAEKQNLFFDWLDSGSRSSEAFKLLVLSSLFLGALHFAKFHGADALRSVSQVPGNMMARAQKNKRDSRNEEIVRAAQAEWRDIQIRGCEALSESRGQLLKCISEIGKGQ